MFLFIASLEDGLQKRSKHVAVTHDKDFVMPDGREHKYFLKITYLT